MNITRLAAALQEMNEIGYTPGEGITRLAYSKEHGQVNDYFICKCKEEGMQVRIDPCGNVIARREGTEPGLPAVACGSHLDTVLNGGPFDGILGVAAGLELVRSLNENGTATRHPIEVIAFACEESSRFGVSTVGSKMMAGKLDQSSLGKLKDREGVTFPEALASVGLDFGLIDKAKRSGKELKAFYELHIEQGPLLENAGKEIGIVTGIAAPTRYEIKVQGKASHTGTTPMTMRKDALVGAAEIIIGLEQAALAEASHGTVATAGVCDVYPGAMNVIPDSVILKVDIRGTVKESKKTVTRQLSAIMERLEKTRGLQCTTKLLSDETPVPLSGQMVRLLSGLCESQGIDYLKMMSGAGHDAMNMAGLCPTGLIFIPSRDGLSHHKDEFSSLEQIAKGAAILKAAVLCSAELVQRSEDDAIGKIKSVS